MATLIAVDDDLDLLRLIRIALEKDGHRVLTFANPEAVGENDWAQADLILLDVMMPQQSGFEPVSYTHLFANSQTKKSERKACAQISITCRIYIHKMLKIFPA